MQLQSVLKGDAYLRLDTYQGKYGIPIIYCFYWLKNIINQEFVVFTIKILKSKLNIKERLGKPKIQNNSLTKSYQTKVVD